VLQDDTPKNMMGLGKQTLPDNSCGS